MNGKVSKMLRKMSANDKRSKKLYLSLTAEQKSRVRAVYDPKDPGKAVIELMKQTGHIG